MTREYTVPALDKAFNLVDLLIAAEKGVSLSQLAKALNEQPGSVFRLLNSMVARGYITRDLDSGQYSISPLGKFISPTEHLKLVAVPMIESLLQRVPYSCHLSVLSGNSQLVIYNGLSKVNFLQVVVIEGRVVNSLETYTGMLMLSRLEKKKLNAFFRSQKLTEKKESQLMAKIEALSTQRSIVRESLAIDGIIDVISAGGQNSKKLIWAISCPVLKKNMEESDKDEIITELETLIDSISSKFN